MLKLGCTACGGSLREDGKNWICENCRTRFAMSRDDEGKPFVYIPVEKKSIECGQMAAKAAALEVSSVTVREIKLKDNIGVEVHNESLNLDTAEIIGLAETYVQAEEWEKVQAQINRLLLADRDNAHAQWYGIMHTKRISSDKELIKRWSDFSQADKIKLDNILANSSPDFAKRIIDLTFENAYANDNMCNLMLSAVLPYAKNESVYTQKELEAKISKAFEVVIGKTYENAFTFLLTHTLRSDEIDRYITYLDRFAGNCSPLAAQKYYRMIIEVDPGNIEIRKKLVLADVKADTDKAKCIEDFEGLLKYSKDTDGETLALISYLNNEKTTTPNKSKLFWDLLGYHSQAPEGLMNELEKYAVVLLNSSLWLEARNYLNLMLSVDSRNADAYFGLCLARIHARNTEEIPFKKENLIDCPEFDKCLSLYKTQGNKKKFDQLMSYTQKQKSTRATAKLVITAAAAVLVAIVMIFAFNKISHARKYSVNNIVVSVTEKETVESTSFYDAYETNLKLRIKNKSSQGIETVRGEIIIYNSDDDILVQANTVLNIRIESGDNGEIVLNIDPRNTEHMEELCALGLENIKITFRVTSVIYEDYNQTDYPEAKEKVINKITEKLSYKEAKAAAIKAQYQAAMEAYKKVDIQSPGFEDDVLEAATMLDDIWEDLIESEQLTADMYGTALEYKNDGEYEKAYYLFAMLASAEYKDSSSQANDCYALATSDY